MTGSDLRSGPVMVPKHRSTFTLAQARWSQRLRRHRPSPPQSELWPLHRRQRGIADRHLDAAHRGGLADMAIDRIGRMAGRHGFRRPVPDRHHRSDRGRRRGPVGPASCHEDQSGAGHGAVDHPVPADRQRPDHHRNAAGPDGGFGSDRRFQPTRPSGADPQPRPAGGSGRGGRDQLDHLQFRALHRPGGRRAS